MTCRRQLTPIQKIRLQLRRAELSADVRFALLPTLGADTKPIIFSELDDLCRRIHREREGAMIQLGPFEAHLRDDPPERKRQLTTITTRLEDGSHGRFLGFAYVDGASWRALQAGLYALEPNPAAYGETV